MSSATEINQVRERVLKLAREIEQLSKSTIPPETFFPQFLQMLVNALGAPAGAVWMLADGGRLGLSSDVRFAETGILDDPQAGLKNQKLLTEVIQTGEASAYSPDDDSDTELPSSHLIILAAIQLENDSVGVVQIFQRSDAPAEARPGFLQFVEQMTGYASRYLARQRKAADVVSPEEFWNQFEQYSLQLQRSLDVEEVASTVASDGRLLLGCDRVSVAVRRGKKISVKAISGQDAVNPRANLVREMVRVSTKVMALGEPVTYSGKVDHLAPQIEEPLADYIQESGSRMVMLIPLTAAKPLVMRESEEEDRKKKAKKPEVIGCLVVEKVADSELPAELVAQTKLVADHAAAALSNARIHQRVLFLRTWKFLGRTLEWFHGRKLAKTLAILSIITAIVLSMVFIPWDYRIEGKGKLMPVIQQEVFCPQDGEVEKIYVQSGQRVEKGQPLFLLRNDALDEEILVTKNKLTERQQLVLSLQAQRDEANKSTDDTEVTRIEGKIEETREEIKGLNRQVIALNEKLKRLTIRAPIAGTIATFQIEKLLRNRPVKRGETLLEIMEDRGKWHLELEVEEQRMGHLLRAQNDLHKENLDVEFILATATESTFDGELKKISTRANTSGEEGNIVEIFVATDVSKLPNRRIGAEVRAKINCGQRSLGYVLFGDVVEFVQKYLWL
jgi:multidrug efflux pump subunit AcrA (membrane-fusion protein)